MDIDINKVTWRKDIPECNKEKSYEKDPYDLDIKVNELLEIEKLPFTADCVHATLHCETVGCGFSINCQTDGCQI